MKKKLNFGQKMAAIRKTKKEAANKAKKDKQMVDDFPPQPQENITFGSASYIFKPKNMKPFGPTTHVDPPGTVILQVPATNDNLIERAITRIEKQVKGL